MNSGGFEWPSGGSPGQDENGSYPDDYRGGSSLARRDDRDRYQGRSDYDWTGQASVPSGYGQDGYGGGHQAGPYGGGYGPDPYGGHYDAYGHAGGYDQPGYGQDGYGAEAYGANGYAHDPYGPSGPGGYQNGYGQYGYDQSGYGQAGQDPYGPDGYGHGSYGQNGHDQNGYGQNGYGNGTGYGSEGYGPGAYAGDGHAAQDYGRDVSDSYGREMQGQEGYGSGRTGTHSRPDAGYGQADHYGATESYRQPGRHGRPDQGAAADQDATSSYQRPALSAGQDRDDSGAYAAAPEAPADAGSQTGPDWFSGTDSGSIGRPDTGSFGRPDTGSFGRPDTGSFGRPDTGSFGRPDTGSFGRQDTGSFDRSDTGSYDGPVTGAFIRPDTGSFGRPDTGSFGRPDTGSFGRPDTGSFGSTDAGSFDGPVTGAFSRPDTGSYWAGDQADAYGQPAGSEPDEDSLAPLPPSSRAGGYGQWQPNGEDADFWDGADADDLGQRDDLDDDRPGGAAGGGDLLSRRFGVDGDDDGGGRRGRGGRGGRGGRSKRPRRGRGKVAVIASILAAALVLGAVADYGYQRYQAWHNGRYGDYTGAGYGTVHFTVPSGASLSALGPQLMKLGIIKELRPFDSAASAASNAGTLQPGVYLLHHHMSAADAVTYLLNVKNRLKDQITITEGMRASAIAEALSKQTSIPVSQFTQIIDNPPASLGIPSWSEGKTAEGFLFPDTYTLLPHEKALDILKMMVSEFNTQVAKINLVGESHKVFTTPWHALIVASMVQAEAGNPGDFGKISRVAWNRLGKHMLLEFDSTVFYAMGTYGTAATGAQTHFKSPYNTYLHTGLPPGPIGNPGVAAMQAAVHPTKGNWLYFITDTRKKPYKTYYTASLSKLQEWQHEFGN